MLPALICRDTTPALGREPAQTKAACRVKTSISPNSADMVLHHTFSMTTACATINTSAGWSASHLIVWNPQVILKLHYLHRLRCRKALSMRRRTRVICGYRECQSAFPPAIPVAIGEWAWHFSPGCSSLLIHHHTLSSSFPPMRKFNPLAHMHLVNFSVPVCHCHHGNSPQRYHSSSATAGRLHAAPCLLCHLAFGSGGLQRAMPTPRLIFKGTFLPQR